MEHLKINHNKEIDSRQFTNIILMNMNDEFTKSYYNEDISAETSHLRAQFDQTNDDAIARPISIIPRRYSFARWKMYRKDYGDENLENPIYTIKDTVFVGNYSYNGERVFLKRNIYIKNCVFEEAVTFNNLYSLYNIVICNCFFKKDLRINKLISKSIKIEKSVFEGSVFIDSCQFKSFELLSCNLNVFKINNTFLLDEDSIDQKFKLFDLLFRDVYISVSDFSSVDISLISGDKIEIEVKCNNLFINNEQLIYKPVGDLFTGDSLSINNLKINFIEKYDKIKAIVRSLDVNELSITGILAGKNALIKDLTIRYLYLVDFTNEGKIYFQNIVTNFSGGFRIYNSTLGKSEFNNADFRLASEFVMIGSNIIDTILINTKLPNTLNESLDDYQSIREGYKQIKQIYSKQGNRFEEMNASKNEMKFLYKSLSFKTDFFDKSVLALNGFSNNYGYDVKVSTVSLFSVVVFTYTVYCIALGYRLGNNFDMFMNLGSFVLEYVNPLHKADFIAESLDIKIGKFARIWDGISRVVISYFLYQFIQAFRKFGK